MYILLLDCRRFLMLCTCFSCFTPNLYFSNDNKFENCTMFFRKYVNINMNINVCYAIMMQFALMTKEERPRAMRSSV